MIRQVEQILEVPDLRVDIDLLIESAVAAVNARRAVQKALQFDHGSLKVDGGIIQPGINGRIRIVSIGKAGLEMAEGAMDVLGELVCDGLVITKQSRNIERERFDDRIILMTGGHPMPTEASLQCGQALWNFLKDGKEGDLILTFISGGGSSLVQLPKSNITIHDLQILTKLLFKCGASIHEINTIRKQLDQLKGGGLLRAAFPAKLACLYISDVKDNPLNLIASGMTVVDDSGKEEAINILEKYDLMNIVPQAIKDELSGADKEKVIQAVSHPSAIHQILLDNSSARKAVVDFARMKGWQVQNLGWVLEGEARVVGRNLAEMLRISAQALIDGTPICLVGGGETIVHIQGKGIGGRNLETALGGIETLAGIGNVVMITLATDGEDGETGFAGALISGKTARLAAQTGMNPDSFLDNNDSLRFFESTGGLIHIGSTGTNVNDLVILLAW